MARPEIVLELHCEERAGRGRVSKSTYLAEPVFYFFFVLF